MTDSGPEPFVDVDPTLLLEIEKHAVGLAKEAGTILLTYFHRELQLEYKSKGQGDPVTEADRKAEELITSGIRLRYPQHDILAEETPEFKGTGSDYLWVVDPLDGTTNFVNWYPFFAVSIGILYKGFPVAGAIFVPTPLVAGGQVLHAHVGGGAFAEGAPIHVYSGPEPSHGGLISIPGYSWMRFRVSRDLRRRLGDMRVTGSVVYELALLASGALQYAAFAGPRIWDVAAGTLIVREAGGQVLVHRRGRRWEPLLSFLSPTTGLPADGDIAKWRAWLLAGNPAILSQVTQGLRPRIRLWRWLRRLGVRWIS